MYAIVEIAGQQFKVEKDQEIFVHRIEGEAGSSIELDNVLFLDNDGKISIGSPVIDDVLVKGKILEHLKGYKVIVFHKKRRKGYQKENGHRQYLSKILIEDILTGAKKSAKKETKKVEAKEEKAKTDSVKSQKKAEAAEEKPKSKAKAEKPEKEEKSVPKTTQAKQKVKKAESTVSSSKESQKKKAEEPEKAENTDKTTTKKETKPGKGEQPDTGKEEKE